MLTDHLSTLIGFLCEAILWGSYVVLFSLSIWVLSRREKRGTVNVPINVVSCILFATCTAHFVLEFYHFYMQIAVGNIEGFGDTTNIVIGANIMLSVCDLLGDVILVYRCWVIWERNHWIALLPALTAFGGLACIGGVVHIALTLSPENPDEPAAFVPLQIAGYVLPLCTNVMSTSLILYAIRNITMLGGSSLSNLPSTTRISQAAVVIIVESGMLYLAVQLVLVVLISLDHPAQDVVAPIALQIYGITPTLIVIRVGLGLSVESTGATRNSFVDTIRFREGPPLYDPTDGPGLGAALV